jgi:hypothetical protein
VDTAAGVDAAASAAAASDAAPVLKRQRLATADDGYDGSGARWVWQAGRDRFEPFSAGVSRQIELAHAAGRQSVQIGGGRAVDLRQMRQFVVAEPWRTRTVRRELN